MFKHLVGFRHYFGPQIYDVNKNSLLHLELTFCNFYICPFSGAEKSIFLLLALVPKTRHIVDPQRGCNLCVERHLVPGFGVSERLVPAEPISERALVLLAQSGDSCCLPCSEMS